MRPRIYLHKDIAQSYLYVASPQHLLDKSNSEAVLYCCWNPQHWSCIRNWWQQCFFPL